MGLTKQLSQIDRFDAAWSAIEKREGQSLKQLKAIATVRSVGASTRIEGSKMTDDEVAVFLKNIAISIMEERDQQEVAGYFETLELIAASFRDIPVTETTLKYLHNTLMRYSQKDAWHKGDYKQHSNRVEAQHADGTSQIIFNTTAPGYLTADAMRNLAEWYNTDAETHTLIKVAVFVYEFLSIHPFQDGNGRLSRLLATLLLLKHGYSWIQYVSFEHEIENRKAEYYRVLMQCQRQRPGEDVYAWVLFFLDCMKNIQHQLEAKLEVQHKTRHMTARERQMYNYVANHPGCRSGEVAANLAIPLSRIKRILSAMVKSNLLFVQGSGTGTTYYTEGTAETAKDETLLLTDKQRVSNFSLHNATAYIEIKKIILTPLFSWQHPGEWSSRVIENGLCLYITCTTATGTKISQSYNLSAYLSPYLYQPVLSILPAITIPESLFDKPPPGKKDYPVQVSIELYNTGQRIDFDVLLVFDRS